MISTTAVTFALVWLVSLVAAADPADNMDVNASDLTSALGMGTAKTPSLFVPIGVVTNKLQPSGNNVIISRSNILLSKSDRVALAHTIKEMLSTDQESHMSPLSTMSADDIFGLLTRAIQNPAMISSVSVIMSAASSGDKGALARTVLGLATATPPTAAPVAVAAPVVVPVTPAVVTPIVDTADVVTPPSAAVPTAEVPVAPITDTSS